MPRTSRKNDPRPHAVYRCFTKEDVLLYVGSSVDPDYRWAALSTSRWTQFHARRADEWHPNGAAAVKAEMNAIQCESPVFNVHGNIRSATQLGAAPTLRWLRRPDMDPVPCVYHGGMWMIGEGDIEGQGRIYRGRLNDVVDEVRAAMDAYRAERGLPEPMGQAFSRRYYDEAAR